MASTVIDVLSDWAPPVIFAVLVGVGVWLRRRGGDLDQELGSGLVVVGAWMLHFLLLGLLDLAPGVSNELFDIAVTLVIAVVLARRWKRLDQRTAATLAALVVFAWLAMSRGDWIAFLGGFLSLPAILVVVVGIAFSLAADAGFTAQPSRRFPVPSRVLLFVGYLVLSVTLLHWAEATHATSITDSAAAAGFFALGIPWAAWLVARRVVYLADEDEEVEVLEGGSSPSAVLA
jgi:hypothetical protein